MDHERKLTVTVLAVAVALAQGTACDRPDPNKLLGDGGAGTGGDSAGAGATESTSEATGSGGGAATSALDARTLSYTEALRSASFKLVGDAPSLQEMMDLDRASDADKPAVYEAMIDERMQRPAFRHRMVDFWRGVFRMGGPALGGMPSLDTAPVFAAKITVEGRPFTDLLTAQTGTCPMFDEATGAFSEGSCDNGITPTGILTDPGVHALYYGNMAFRRTRFFHETFLCRSATEAVAEPRQSATNDGPPGYASAWAWGTITGGPGALVDFLAGSGQDSVICANCHATWNHRAPLWANFDEAGQYQPLIAVHVPTADLPFAKRSDWLPKNESTAWKSGVTVADLPELGAAMAADPEVHACAVARLWNYAMSRGDLVETGKKVSPEVIAPFVATFEQGDRDLLKTLKAILLSDDFVRF